MSTTIEQVGEIRPLRHLEIQSISGAFAVTAISMLVSPFREVILRMSGGLPHDIKSQAVDRQKFRLHLLLVGKSPFGGRVTSERFFVLLRLSDLVPDPDGGTRTKNYFYVGYVIPDKNYGEVDEYDGDSFVDCQIMKSLFMCEQLPLFRSL